MMMKRIPLLVLLSSCTIIAGAQTKIGGTLGPADPNAYLHLGDAGGNKGLLLPRVALTMTTAVAPLTAPVAAGMYVYNTATTGDVTPGTYYYDGAKWVRVLGIPPAGDGDAWGVSGEDQNSNIGRTGNVGIGVAAPAMPLDVRGNIAPSTGGLRVMHNNATAGVDIGYSGISSSGTNSNNSLTLDSKGNSPIVINGTNTTGNVGIGVVAPVSKLDVSGTTLLRNGNSGQSSLNNTLLFGYGNSAQYEHAIKTRHDAGSTVGNAIDFYVWDYGTDAATAPGSRQVLTMSGFNNGSVGIGTTAPGAKLEVAGQVKITGGTPGSGKVLTSDANGLATWQAAATDGDAWAVNGEDITSPIRRDKSAAVGAIGSGTVSLNPGTPTNTGEISFNRSNGLRNGYIGYDNTDLTYATENGANHVFNGGTVSIKNMNTATTNSSVVTRDNASGELKAVKSSTGNTALLSTITYTLQNVGGGGDYVADYDTKISTAEYSVSITGFRYGNSMNGALIANYGGDFNATNVYAFQSGGTWHLSADFKGAYAPTAATNTEWVLDCLIISNKVVKALPMVTQSLSGSQNGAAASAPAGL
jgi:hypothetical protein